MYYINNCNVSFAWQLKKLDKTVGRLFYRIVMTHDVQAEACKA